MTFCSHNAMLNYKKNRRELAPTCERASSLFTGIVFKFHIHVHIWQKVVSLHKKELSITFGRNIRNMLIIGLCHR